MHKATSIKSTFIIVLALWTLLLPTKLFAAQLKINPEYPKPGESFTAQIVLEPNEYSAQSTWFVDNKIVAKDVSQAEFKATEFGKSQKLKVVLSYPDNSPQTLVREITPIYFDVLYEADTFSPEFMQLAPLSSQGALIKLRAIVKIPSYKSSDLVYVWKKDGLKIPELSGQGKNTAVISPDFFAKSMTITLELLDPISLKKLGSKDIYLIFKNAELSLYTEDSLLGWTFNKVLPDKIYTQESIQILSVPFNLSVQNIFSPMINWVWLVNGKNFNPDTNSPYVEIQFSKPDANKADIQVIAQYKKHILQKAQKAFKIFRKSNQDNLNLGTTPHYNSKDDTGFGI